MIIIVTGTPGTGKTTYSKKLAIQKKLRYVDVKKLIEKEKLYSGFDKKRYAYIVDEKKLSKFLVKIIKKENNLVIDSHLSHYISPKHVDICIVTKCDLKTLEKRLKKRKYSKAKIRENLDAEIFDTSRIEALENGHNVKVVWTDKKTK